MLDDRTFWALDTGPIGYFLGRIQVLFAYGQSWPAWNYDQISSRGDCEIQVRWLFHSVASLHFCDPIPHGHGRDLADFFGKQHTKLR